MDWVLEVLELEEGKQHPPKTTMHPKGQLPCNEATSDRRKQPCSSTTNVQWQELLSYTAVQ